MDRGDLDVRQPRALAGAMAASPAEDRTAKCCAYNQTRERFLSAAVEVVGSSASSIDAHLPGLTRGSGAALWIAPARAISPTSVRLPIDLLYLDVDHVVLDSVESFPISTPSSALSLATSVLALPATSIASGMIRSGDRLIVCPPEEMKLRLEQLGGASTEAPSIQSRASLAPYSDQPQAEATRDAVTRSDGLSFESKTDTNPAFQTAVARGIKEPAEKPPEGAKKNWLRRLLWGDPPEPRKASRESLSWLVVYFFTGGDPVAHEVRDVSLTGLYVFTEERWYLGTVVRLTLTDGRHLSSDATLTLNARVVRWGDDGVGFEFLLLDKKGDDSRMIPTFDGTLVHISKSQLKKFLQELKTGAA